MPKRKTYANCSSMLEVKQLNEVNDYCFFERGTMRFFNSHIQHTPPIGGFLFITSERERWDKPRLYTIRAIRENGKIETIGDFGSYYSSREARRVAQDLAPVLRRHGKKIKK